MLTSGCPRRRAPHTSPPRDGWSRWGVEVNSCRPPWRRARVPRRPRRGGREPQHGLHGGDASCRSSDIDLAVEVDEPLGRHEPRPPADVHRVIGERIASCVPPGATLQLGIGAIPDSALSALPDRRGLRVWTEMFSDGMLGLAKAGALADGVSRPRSPPAARSSTTGSTGTGAWCSPVPSAPTTVRHQPTAGDDLDQRRAAGRPVRGGERLVRAAADLLRFRRAERLRRGRAALGRGQAIVGLPSWHEPSDTSTIVERLDGPRRLPAHLRRHRARSREHLGRSQREQAAELIDHAAAPAASGPADARTRWATVPGPSTPGVGPLTLNATGAGCRQLSTADARSSICLSRPIPAAAGDGARGRPRRSCSGS